MSLFIVAIIVFVLWIGAFAYFLAASNRASQIQDDLQSVKNLLDQREEK